MRVTLLTNAEKDRGKIKTRKIYELLSGLGVEVGCINAGEEIPDATDVLLTLGGDGTLLHSAVNAAVKQVPILGINIGTLGYLAELEANEIEMLKKLAMKDYMIEPRMMIDISIKRGNNSPVIEHALNDVVITHGEIMKVITLGLYCDGEKIKSFRGDGIITSTPTGSTAYSLSAGGPIVDPLSESITVTPLSAHAFFAKSFVFSDKRKIEIAVEKVEKRSAMMSADGREALSLGAGDRITITKSKLITELIRISGRTFISTLNRKL